MITRRRVLAASGGLAALAAAGPAAAQEPAMTVPTARRIRTMEIKRSGSQPSAKGPAEYFTGAVRIDPLFTATDPARANGASVTFEPGARTAWHTHPLGQTLIVTAGSGRAQRWGGPGEEIYPGDVILCAPGEKHWHGAPPDGRGNGKGHAGVAGRDERGGGRGEREEGEEAEMTNA